jgi:uncharacterized membrane protein YbhN (UPF0104 family)
MSDPSASRIAPVDRRRHRWPLRCALVGAAAGAAFLLVPAFAGVPARLVQGCGKWIAIAGVFELLSAVGFVIIFKLVFAARISWRRGAPAALSALGASTLLPAGGLIGPSVGAWSTRGEKPSLPQLTRSTITFVLLTNAPGAIVLTILGALLWLGLPSGPHQALLTLLPALLAAGLLGAAWLAANRSRAQPAPRRARILSRALAKPVASLSDGIGAAHALVAEGNWKLAGAFGYYAFDNAVLWAAFHAYGRTPPIAVVVMGYLVGSLAGALPLPAGLGAVDGGLIGALVLYGAPLAPAAAAVLLFRGISLSLPAVLGALGWVCRASAERPPRVARRLAARQLRAL